jgi:Domain of unknown function (DUF4402)
MGAMAKQMKAAGTAVALALALLSNAAIGATAVGHVSVTILPAAAAVVETMPIELDVTGRRLATRPGVVTLTGAPNEAITISVSANDPVTGPGPALQLGRFTHNAGRAPTLSSDGSLTLAVATTVQPGASQPHGAYAGSYSVIVNY